MYVNISRNSSLLSDIMDSLAKCSAVWHKTKRLYNSCSFVHLFKPALRTRSLILLVLVCSKQQKIVTSIGYHVLVLTVYQLEEDS